MNNQSLCKSNQKYCLSARLPSNDITHIKVPMMTCRKLDALTDFDRTINCRKSDNIH